MVLDLKVSVKRQIDRLRKDLAAATDRVAALRDEIERHEQIYGMLEGNTGRGRRAGRPRAEQKRGPKGSMINWNGIFETLPPEFTLDTLGADKTAREKPRAYLRQVVVRWSKEGRVQRTGRGKYQKV